MTRQFVLEDQFPGPLISLNAAYKMRNHERHAASVVWRDAVFWLTKATRPAPFDTKVRIGVTFVVRDPARQRDGHNFVATTKPMIDGLRHAGLIVDDDVTRVVCDDVTFVGPSDGRKANTFIITVTEEPS